MLPSSPHHSPSALSNGRAAPSAEVAVVGVRQIRPARKRAWTVDAGERTTAAVTRCLSLFVILLFARALTARPAGLAERAPPRHLQWGEVRPPSAAAVALREQRSFDLNRASERELRMLPGIGPALAARIVEHRRRYGGFLRVASLRDVRGIGPKLVARLGPFLHVRIRPGARLGIEQNPNANSKCSAPGEKATNSVGECLR